MLGGDLERLSVRALVKRQLASLSEPDPSAVTLLPITGPRRALRLNAERLDCAMRRRHLKPERA